MAAMMGVENWDDDVDLDFQGFQPGALHASTGTAGTAGAGAASVSSRMSVHSESLAGDEEWNVVVQHDDDNGPSSTRRAIESAQQAGIPLPSNVPTSALLAGPITRLGQKKTSSRRLRQNNNDDWDQDIDMPDSGAPLKLKAVQPPPFTPGEEQDDFDELEGSLGIRFAGTKRDARNRSSSVSAVSPSLGSMTAESEDDDLRGLELPEGPMDLEAILKKRRAADAELSDLSQQSPQIEQPATMNVHKKSKLLTDDNDDFLNDFDLGGGDILDVRKRTANKNIRVKSTKPAAPVLRSATTINFHDKPTEKPMHTRSHIPRPVSGSKPAASRLEPVFESGASHAPRERRQQPTTTGAQLLKSKRSMPALRSQPSAVPTLKSSVPFLSSGASNTPSQHTQAHRPMPYHLRRDSDPHRGGAASPPLRSHSRLSNALVAPDTPSRGPRQQHSRPDLAPAALAREAAAKRTVTRPTRRRNYGDGHELEVFDDLPTSVTKERAFTKAPVTRGPTTLLKQPGLRQTQSRTDLRDPFSAANKRPTGIPDRMMTPAPPRTPASPTKGFYEPGSGQPSYLRDTAASRIARETRLANANAPRPRSEGPLMPLTANTNWKQHVAARSPHHSPGSGGGPLLLQQRAGRQTGSGGGSRSRPQPQLIKGIGAHVAKTEKGMVYNPLTLRWEGNENSIAHFDIPPPLETPTPTGLRHQESRSYLDHHPRFPSQGGGAFGGGAVNASPPRPALIAPMSTAGAQGVQVNGGMVFDPRLMKWLKLKNPPHAQKNSIGRPRTGFSTTSGAVAGGVPGPLSPSVTEGEDDEDDDEEEDAFAGIADLKDDFPAPAPSGGAGGLPILASPVSIVGGRAAAGAAGGTGGVGDMHEEFDLGPKFIETQIAEEGLWRRRCAAWFPLSPSMESMSDGGTGVGEAERPREPRAELDAWRWAIRDMVPGP